MENSINYCSKFRGIALSEHDDVSLLARLRCKQWHCEYCAKVNAKLWRDRLRSNIRDLGGLWSFWTITLDSWIHNQEEREDRYFASLIFVQKNWDTLLKRIRRYAKKIDPDTKLEYVRVLETHKSGVIHIHLLVNIHVHDAELKQRQDGSWYNHSDTILKHLNELGFGRIHDCRNLVDLDGTLWHHNAIAAYITGYISSDSKFDDELRRRKRVRKFQTSHGIAKVELETDELWTYKHGLDIEDFQAREDKVYDVTLKKVISVEDFRGGIVYPPYEDHMP